MRLIQPPPEAVPFGLRAMKMVATAGRPLSAAATQILNGAQRVLLQSNLALEGLLPIGPDELASAIRAPELRRQLVQGMLMLSLSDGPPSPAQIDSIEEFARALDVNAPELHTLRLLADQQMLLFRLDFLRRSHLRDVFEQQLREKGLLGSVKSLLGLKGFVEDRELAARYHALEKLPADSLGQGLVEYLRRNQFAFPGEKGGFPESAIWHDFGHVLTGYNTDPAGECQMAAFQAGYKQHNPFFMLLFGALTFSAGINVTPLPQPNTQGLLAQEGLAESILLAIERGARLKRDLAVGWDHWSFVAMPIDEAREALGVGPVPTFASAAKVSPPPMV